MPELSATILGSVLLKKKDDWEGRIVLPAWKGFQSCLGAYGGTSSKAPSTGEMHLRLGFHEPDASDQPSPVLVDALQTFIQNQNAIRDAMVEKIIEYVQDFRDEEGEDLAPNIKTLAGLKKNAGPSILHVFAQNAEAPVYIGMELGCTWEWEHGLGVVTHEGKVMAVGQAAEAFIEPGAAQEFQPDVREFRKRYFKVSNDHKTVTLTVSPPLTIEQLGDLSKAYQPNLSKNGARFTGLLGLEAIVLAEVLSARGMKVKSSGRRDYDLKILHEIYPEATDLDAVMKVMAKARLAWKKRGTVRPENGSYFSELSKAYSVSKVYDEAFMGPPEPPKDPEEVSMDKFFGFFKDPQSAILEVSPSLNAEGLADLYDSYQLHLREDGSQICVAGIESIFLEHVLRQRGYTVQSAGKPYDLAYFYEIFPAAKLESLESILRIMMKTRADVVARLSPGLRELLKGHNPWNNEFVEDLDKIYPITHPGWKLWRDAVANNVEA